MRPVDKGPVPIDANGIPKTYSEYGLARRDLIERLGQYCSYCEQFLPTSLAVEHVQPKSINPSLELTWDNFLLGCTNCNSIKGKTDVNLDNYIWPDRENTFSHFDYNADGTVTVKESLEDRLKSLAENLRTMVGLQRTTPPIGTGDYNRASDRRHENRLSRFIVANDVKLELETAPNEAKPYIVREICRLAQAGGFWSVWMTVFEGHADVRRALIDALPNTRQEFFNDQGNVIP